MNKKWLFNVALLALMLPTLPICSMEVEAIREDFSDEPTQQIESESFLKKVQMHGLPSPDGLLVAKCVYKTSESSSRFVEQKDLERCAELGSYPWNCYITICMAEGREKEVGRVSAAGTTLHKLEWLEGNQLRVLAATLTGVKQLQWFDHVYALDGTWLNNGMDQRLRSLIECVSSIQSAQ